MGLNTDLWGNCLAFKHQDTSPSKNRKLTLKSNSNRSMFYEEGCTVSKPSEGLQQSGTFVGSKAISEVTNDGKQHIIKSILKIPAFLTSHIIPMY